MSTIKLKTSLLTLITFCLLLVNCSDNKPGIEEEVPEYVTETKTNLLGEWILLSRTINNKNTTSSDFEFFKESRANFYENNTYNLIYKTKNVTSSGVITSTNTQEGTYTIDALNKVTFFKSSSDVKFIVDRVQITTTTNNPSGVKQVQIDVFVRNDNKELLEEKDMDVIDESDEDLDVIVSTYDGTAVISKLLGKWKIDNQTNECLKMNTIEFKSKTLFEIIQHKTTFNRNDLLRNNLSVSYPMPAIFSATATKGNETVTFDTEANCQFIKKNELEYIVVDEKTVSIKSSSKAKLILEDNTTLKLVFNYSDANGDAQVVEFRYKKI